MKIIEWNLALNGENVLNNESNDDLRHGSDVASDVNIYVHDCIPILASLIIVLMIHYMEMHVCVLDCVLDWVLICSLLD